MYAVVIILMPVIRIKDSTFATVVFFFTFRNMIVFSAATKSPSAA